MLTYAGKHGIFFPLSVKLALCVTTTIVISYLVYEYFEKYFMKMGKQKKVSSARDTGFVKQKGDMLKIKKNTF